MRNIYAATVLFSESFFVFFWHSTITCVEALTELFMHFSHMLVFIVVIIFIVASCLGFLCVSSPKE